MYLISVGTKLCRAVDPGPKLPILELDDIIIIFLACYVCAKVCNSNISETTLYNIEHTAVLMACLCFSAARSG